MKHQVVRWKPVLEQWFCAKCGQTHDHLRVEDAREELEQYDCQPPWTDLPVDSWNKRYGEGCFH
jgi:hypothetical protein